MAPSNYERIGKALELLRSGLKPFVEREMEAALGPRWLEQARASLRREPDLQTDGEPHLDAYALLVIVWNQWNEVFRNTLGFAERSLVSEIREVRNRWAHQQPFSTDDTYRALDSIVRLLTAISAPEAQEVEQHKQEVLRIRFEEQTRHERRKAAALPIEGQPTGSLRPWREVVTPHPDVSSGRYLQAEFAADLAAVHRGDANTSSEYKDPREFFQRTFLTDGLRQLLRTALNRLTGQSGDPVVELQTNFGGGKTHSMLALFHLFAGVRASELSGVDGILNDLSLAEVPKANRAVLVGTALSPGQTHQKPDGTIVHTLWGELAWQLGGKAGYALVAQADRQGVSPGSNVLHQLFSQHAPCLILIDEWVTFLRQLYRVEGLPAGSFDANMSFVQSLTEAAKAAPRTLVVASLPASQIEVGGEGGQEALTRLKNTFGRVEATWRPASAEESFEIVRRRLFQTMTASHLFTARDAVVDAFSRLYREQPQEFPPGCGEGEYKRRMVAAYPIHPELFDRLYTDWSSLEKFQRTRGVLRLMAAVIYALWARDDRSLLILPSSVPVDDAGVFNELKRHLEENWDPIIERDVDGPASLPLALDKANPNLMRYSACRRVARTIFMGSAPTANTRNPGLDERSVKLGCVQPGESAATFGDALRRMTDQATHLYLDRSRYWFSTQPSVARLAQDRAAQVDMDTVWEELRTRLRADRQRGDLAAVHLAPTSTGEVPDEPEARLVVLGPRFPHARGETGSPARQEAAAMLKQRGNSPRLNQNALVFLAPDRARLAELEDGLRQYLAWQSIRDEQDTLNLDTFQRNQARTKHEQADTTVRDRIQETYIWLLVPEQPDPRNPELEWKESRLQGPDPLAVRASRKLRSDEQLITQFSGLRLRMEMDKYNLWQEADHVGVKTLSEYFARYTYLPRLKEPDVLLQAIQDGVRQTTWMENFAYASGWDAARKRYLNLQAGETASVISDGQSLLVRPEAANRQLAEARPAEPARPGAAATSLTGTADRTGLAVEPTQPPPARRARRFHGTVELDPTRPAGDAGKVAEAIIQHLTSVLGAHVRVTLEIQAELSEGVTEQVVRTVSENARTLKFREFGFEDE